MNDLTPEHVFTPIHLAWLKHRDMRGQDVSSADLEKVKRHHPEAASDPLFVQYATLAAAGKLHRKRGRKPWSKRLALLHAANAMIDNELDDIWKDRRESGVRCRSDDSPIFGAAEKVARSLRLSSGRSLLNELYRRKMRNNYRARKSARGVTLGSSFSRSDVSNVQQSKCGSPEAFSSRALEPEAAPRESANALEGSGSQDRSEHQALWLQESCARR